MIFGSGVSAAALFSNCAMVLSLCGRRFAGPSLDAACGGGGGLIHFSGYGWGERVISSIVF